MEVQKTEIVVIDTNLITIQTSNISAFLLTVLMQQNHLERNHYLWVSHQTYDLVNEITELVLERKFRRDRCVYKVKLNNFRAAVEDISSLFLSYEMWALWITSTKIRNFSEYEWSFPKSDTLLYKGNADNVIWIYKEKLGRDVKKINFDPNLLYSLL